MEGLEIPSISIDEKELTVYRERAVVVAEQAKAIAESIHDAVTCQMAVDWCSAQLTFADTVKRGWLGRIRDMWHKQHKSVCVIISEFTDPHEQGVSLVKASIAAWRAEAERTRQADQARLLADSKDGIVPVLAPETLKNVGGHKRWKVRETDKVAFIKAVAGGAVPHNAVIIDTKWLDKQATLMDGHLTYPGIECYEEEIISIRRSA